MDRPRLDHQPAALRRADHLIVVFFLGVIWAAFDGRKQGWHDKIACTLVFRDPA